MPTKLELIATIARLINQVGRWGLRLPLGCSCSWHSLPCWGSDASPPRRGNRGAHCPWTRLRRVLSPASFLLIPPPSPPHLPPPPAGAHQAGPRHQPGAHQARLWRQGARRRRRRHQQGGVCGLPQACMRCWLDGSLWQPSPAPAPLAYSIRGGRARGGAGLGAPPLSPSPTQACGHSAQACCGSGTSCSTPTDPHSLRARTPLAASHFSLSPFLLPPPALCSLGATTPLAVFQSCRLPRGGANDVRF